METHLRFYLLGPFEAWRGDARIPAKTWRTRKHAALLKILLGERGRVVPADRLVEWLWPDLAPAAGQANLHVGISLLRRVLQPGLKASSSVYIRTCHPGYRFDPSPGCWVDVDGFVAHLDAARGHVRQGAWAQAMQSYTAAVDLYRGDYLADDPYEDWALGPPERLRDDLLDALRRLSALHLEAGDAAAALSWAQRLLEPPDPKTGTAAGRRPHKGKREKPRRIAHSARRITSTWSTPPTRGSSTICATTLTCRRI